jgi:hypothetical protein
MDDKKIEKREIIEEDFYKISFPQDRLKFLLIYGILAPSTHNSQPWLFKITDNLIEVYKNPKYYLPYADPLNRDLYISIGCCLENLVIASKYFKIFEKLEIILNDDLVARMLFKDVMNNHAPDLNFKKYIDSIKTRQNVRGIFEDQSIDDNIIDEVSALNTFNDLQILFLKDKEKIKIMGELTAEGLRRAYYNKNFRKEMSSWIYSDVIGKRKDGIPTFALKAPFPFSIILPYLVRFFNIGKKLGELNRISIASAPLSIAIFSKKNEPETWVRVGMLGEKVMLHFNSKGIKTSIFVPAIEMGLTKEIKNLFGTDLEPQLHFCAGYMGANKKYTPRRPLDEFIIN